MTIAGVYIDSAVVFVLAWVAILGGWQLWNRWEGDKLHRRLQQECERDREAAPPPVKTGRTT